MRKTLLAVALSGFAPGAFAGNGEILKAQAGMAVPGQYIVVLNADIAPGKLGPHGLSVAPGVSVAQASADLTLRYGGSVLRSYQYALRGFAIRTSEAAARAMARDSRVAYVEEDGLVFASGVQTNPPSYGLDRIDQRDLPFDSQYSYNSTGDLVYAFIIDTGIRATHHEFGTRVFAGFDGVGDGHGTDDCHGHGTHVAGTVGGVTFGVAKKVALRPVRVLGCNGSGTTSAIIAGIDWVTHNPARPAVANMSLGGSVSQAMDSAVRASIASGVTYAVSAGNGNTSACNQSPARVTAALTVGSTDSTDARSSFSNFGSCVDIFAPGSDITSAWNDSDTGTRTISGTSMATPHVTGAAALVLALHPLYSPAQVAEAIINSASLGKVSNAGAGSPNRLLFAPLAYRTNILVQNDSGQLTAWRIVGGDKVSEGQVGVLGPGQAFQGIGDFDCDGHDDILLRNLDTGQVTIWYTVDGVRVSLTNLDSPGLDSTIQGIGDFDGDGCSDILLRAANGDLTVWRGSDPVTGSIPAGSVPDTDWQIHGVGDFDGDGFADILWRHANGQVAIWLMAVGTKVGELYPGGQDPDHIWGIQQVGDFDRDGRSDILWRDVNGFVAIWFSGDINTAAYPTYQNVYPPVPVPLSWRIEGVGDFNRDARSDILWRDTEGLVAIWFMNGGLFAGDKYPGQLDGSSHLRGVMREQ